METHIKEVSDGCLESYSKFINNESAIFSALDNERCIPSIVDGLIAEKRKILFTCIKRSPKNDPTVSQLANMVCEVSPYHQGKNFIMEAIISLAQDYAGSNNINLLLPLGQFGTRLKNGEDVASPNVITTKLSPITRLIFHPNDNITLSFFQENNCYIEPKIYYPIIPIVLINGCVESSSTHSTHVPSFNPKDIIANIKLLLNGGNVTELKPLKPWYRGFKGRIEKVQDQLYVMEGKVEKLSTNSVRITEIPINMSIYDYKILLEKMKECDSHIQAKKIIDYEDYSTESTAEFVIYMTDAQNKTAHEIGLYEYLNLKTSLKTSSMYLLDKHNCLRRYEDVRDILNEFYQIRIAQYEKRKILWEGLLKAKALKLYNQAKFLRAITDRSLVIQNESQIIDELKHLKYDPDPVKMWHQKIKETDKVDIKTETSDSDYNYIMNLKFGETINSILNAKNDKYTQIEKLRATSKEELWKEDLEKLSNKLDSMNQYA